MDAIVRSDMRRSGDDDELSEVAASSSALYAAARGIAGLLNCGVALLALGGSPNEVPKPGISHLDRNERDRRVGS